MNPAYADTMKQLMNKERLCIALRADIRRAQVEGNKDWEAEARRMLTRYES